MTQTDLFMRLMARVRYVESTTIHERLTRKLVTCFNAQARRKVWRRTCELRFSIEDRLPRSLWEVL